MLTLSIILLFVQTSFGQACGVYELTYIGSVSSKPEKKTTIKLPSTLFFHIYSKKEESKTSFYDFSLKESKIKSTIQSHLTSIYTSNELITLYKSNRDFIPLLITTIDENRNENVQSLKIPIKKLKFRGIDKPNKMAEIIIDLGKIKI